MQKMIVYHRGEILLYCGPSRLMTRPRVWRSEDSVEGQDDGLDVRRREKRTRYMAAMKKAGPRMRQQICIRLGDGRS